MVLNLSSLSNVGVCPGGEQNPCPEGTEASEAEGETFEGFKVLCQIWGHSHDTIRILALIR